MGNMKIYKAVREVPKEAQKPITGGRLRGMTDINPMWRIKALTEQFGPCGIGWKYEITRQWIEEGGNDVRVAFTNINLYIKVGDNWSEAIPGTGGSSFVSKESRGLYTSDECFKMSLTDAISVSCKALGFGADIYWSTDRSKYGSAPEGSSSQKKSTNKSASKDSKYITTEQAKELFALGPEKIVIGCLKVLGYASSKAVEKSNYKKVKDYIADTVSAKTGGDKKSEKEDDGERLPWDVK